MASRDLGATGGSSTPLILGDTREAPRYEQAFAKAASRKSLIAYKDYSSDVDESNQTGVLRRERMTPEKLIPMRVRLVFARKYAGRRIIYNNNQLLLAVEKHAGFVVNGEEPSRHTPRLRNRQSCYHAARWGIGKSDGCGDNIDPRELLFCIIPRGGPVPLDRWAI